MISIHFVHIQFRCWKLSTWPGDVELTLKTSNLGGLETGACSFIQLILVECPYGPALRGLGNTVVNERAIVVLHRTTASEGDSILWVECNAG